MVVRGQKEKIQSGPMEMRSLKMRIGWECSFSRQRARLYSGDIHVEGV